MNTNTHTPPARLSNVQLLARVKQLAQCEREATAALVAHLAELDSRGLYLAEGCSSMFTYCTQVLHLAEHAAYNRIEAARAARRFPMILEMLGDGSLNLATARLLAPHLTPENFRALLTAARHKSRRQVEELVVALRPRPDVPDVVRKLPAAKPGPASSPEVTSDAGGERAAEVWQSGATADSSPPATAERAPEPDTAAKRPAVVVPLAPARFKVQFTASAETCEKLRRAQDLLRHEIPDGDLAKVFDRALTVLLERLSKQKLAATERAGASRGTAPGSRHIPAAVKRAVWSRDGGRCAFVSESGRRCSETGRLEFHHLEPHADGGEPSESNVAVHCRAHNRYEAEQYFGPHELRESSCIYAVASAASAGIRSPGCSILDRSTSRAGPKPRADIRRLEMSLVPGRVGEGEQMGRVGER